MHGGNLINIAKTYEKNIDELTDFSVNINPLGFPEYTRMVISSDVSNLASYPDPDYGALREALSDLAGVSSSEIVPANGSSELLYFLLQLLSPKKLILPVPAYIDYEKIAIQFGIPLDFVFLREEDGFAFPLQVLSNKIADFWQGAAVILGFPNNPTGTKLNLADIHSLAKEHPSTYFIVDLAYYSFIDGDFPTRNGHDNIIFLYSMTKIFGVPGIRLGFTVASKDISHTLSERLPCWRVNSLADTLGQRFARDRAFIDKSIETNNELKSRFIEDWKEFSGIKIYPGEGNFVLFRLLKGASDSFYSALVKKGFVLRRCDDFRGLDSSFFRIGLKSRVENDALTMAVEGVLVELGLRDSLKTHSYTLAASRKKPTPALMFAGTCSNAGKSLMTAAYCRVLSDLGYKVAPFKAQNMSLNSAVTRDGREIGRAQALQASAARVEPDIRMNPVLLKPNSDTGSQVIVNGLVWKNLEAMDYYDQKQYLTSEIHKAYDALAADFEVIVLEGAGSPGEVNLKKNDMVNMPMARHAQSGVVLVGDIDRGGTYASFVGHMDVMEEWERHLLKGFLVNKFRGDARLLKDAHDYLDRYTGKEVLGVMPYLKDHRLPEEDGVDFDLRYGGSSERDLLIVGVVSLPHTSNSTDIDPLINYSRLKLVQIKNSVDISGVHLVIIPGSKNVIFDLNYLKDNGIAQSLIKEFNKGHLSILGICGGFQMMGKEITDPLGIETIKGNRAPGLSILDCTAELAEQKTLKLTETSSCLTGGSIKGYEIHHGISRYDSERELFAIPGIGTWGERSWGTYLHGILENRGFTDEILLNTAKSWGIPTEGLLQNDYDDQDAIDAFAKVFAENVDIDTLLKHTGLK